MLRLILTTSSDSLALSNLVRPSRALVPLLIAKYNISFLDVIGRPPRILPCEYFRSFKVGIPDRECSKLHANARNVLQAFIQHEFKDLPGSAWVNQGRYMILSLANNTPLGEQNCSRSITPGAAVAMSIIV